MSIEKLQQRLSSQITALEQLMMSQPEHFCRLPRFDKQLFSHKGTHLQDYLQEIRQNFSKLSHTRELNRYSWLTERLSTQINALRREILTQSLRTSHELQPISTLQLCFDQHLVYARRLSAMVEQRERQLTNVQTLREQQQLKRELDALAERIMRCQKAIRRIEWQLLQISPLR